MPQRVRIIGGEWRGRVIPVADVSGLRPTPDRVRETLFNWLQPVIDGARCLDLFAGTGALGLEALSRGAREVTLVENDPVALNNLHKAVDTLHAENAHVVQADSLEWLNTPPQLYDIVFLDPPYRQDLLGRCCQVLEQSGWLATDAVIYLENETEVPLPVLPEHWQVKRSKTAGQVAYHLVQRC